MKKSSLYMLLLLLAGTMIITSCSTEKNNGFDLSNIDTTTAPGTDFYQYAVGNWLEENPIPAEYSRWGTFEQLAERNYKILHKLLDNAAASKNSENENITKVGTFYSLGMDSAGIEKAGLKPLEEEYARIEKVTGKKELVQEIAHMHMYSARPLFSFYASQDAKNSDMMIARLYQGGLGLPDRDYYTNDDDRSKEIRAKYVEYLTNLFELIGEEEEAAAQKAQKVMDIETRLAEASMTRLDQRDPEKTYNKMTKEELKEKSPAFDWDLYFASLEVSDPGDINVGQPEFVAEVSDMMKEVSVEDWKLYLTMHLTNSMASYLSSDFVNADFDFYSKFLSGSESIQPRWKRVLWTTNGALGEVVGQIYVKDNFPPESKKRAREMVDNLLVAMGERIKAVEWMNPETKERALKKLSSFKVKIGYPDKWRDYSGLEVKDDSYVKNVMRSNYFDFKDNIAKIGKPVDRSEWHMYPQQVNAYYHPVLNEIVFPAAILQPPFFNPEADDAINYGSIGAVIGHEITHGFDDEGRKYDYDGNIRDWWTEEDSKEFDARAKVIIDQYNGYEAIDSNFVDGALTQGENIADLGGLTVSYAAFKKTEQYKNGEEIDGFTPSQRFFLGWAQAWRNNIRDENLKLRLKTDVHSPGKFRVLGPLANMPEFAEAFELDENAPMVRKGENRVNIW